MRVAVIPARGGSKRIPRKNLRPFAGIPMLARSIATARESGMFERIVVSTDDEEIAALAQAEGAEVPFRRPTHLATDAAITAPVVAHALQELESDGSEVSALCCIYATAPFMRIDDLRRGHRLLVEGNCDYVVPVTTFPYPVGRALALDEHGRASMIDPANLERRSQELVEAFHDTGTFYWGKPDAWRRMAPVFSAPTLALPVPRHLVQDIDTEEDWVRAEKMYRVVSDELGVRSN